MKIVKINHKVVFSVRTGKISVEDDKIICCEFCNAPWTKNSDEYNGGCCEEDARAHDEVLYDAAHQQPECTHCGDTGRSYPTLENPDGVICECVLNSIASTNDEPENR